LVAQESIEHPWKIPKTYGEMEIFHNIWHGEWMWIKGMMEYVLFLMGFRKS
jgi:hypothetical protein